MSAFFPVAAPAFVGNNNAAIPATMAAIALAEIAMPALAAVPTAAPTEPNLNAADNTSAPICFLNAKKPVPIAPTMEPMIYLIPSFKNPPTAPPAADAATCPTKPKPPPAPAPSATPLFFPPALPRFLIASNSLSSRIACSFATSSANTFFRLVSST